MSTETQEAPAKKKVTYKFVNVKKVEVVSTRTTRKPNLVQRLISKVFFILPTEGKQYVMRVQYSGNTRLQKGDVVVSKLDEQTYAVIDEKNRYALLASMPHVTEKPRIHDRLWVLPKPKSKTK